MNINDMAELVGDGKSFFFNDYESTVLIKNKVIGYRENGDDEIGIYIDGWSTVEILNYNDNNIKKDLKMLKAYFI